MLLGKGDIVTFVPRGTEYRSGAVHKPVKGVVMKAAQEGLYVTTGMAVWLVPFGSVTSVSVREAVSNAP